MARASASRPEHPPLPATGLNASNQGCVQVVGSPTMRSALCVPCDSSNPTLPVRSRSFSTLKRHIKRTKCRWPRIAIVIALEKPDVLCPRGAARILFLRLDGDQRRLAFAREDRDVVALHAPVVRQIDDIVGRAHHQGVEIVRFISSRTRCSLLWSIGYGISKRSAVPTGLAFYKTLTHR